MVEIKALKDELIYLETLQSGLRVALHPKPGFHNIYVTMQVDFGGFDMTLPIDSEESSIPAGIAHFLEHLMFHNNDVDLPETFAHLGADVNAFTSKSQTAYKFKTINHINELLKAFMDNFMSFNISDQLIEKERRIIIHELTMSEDSVHFDMSQQLTKMMYLSDKVRADVGGSVKDVKNITRAHLEDAFKAFYHPKNMSLVITGNVDKDQVTRLLKDHPYNHLSWPEFIQTDRSYNDPKRKRHHLTKVSKDANENMITFALKVPKEHFSDQNRIKLHIALGSIVANAFGLGSKTFDDLEKQKLMNVSFFTKLSLERDFGYFEVFIQTNKVKRYQETMMRILENIATETLDESFFDINKRNILGNYITVFDSLSRVHDLLCNVTNEHMALDDYLKQILELQFSDLQPYQKLFVKENIFSITYLKAKKQK